MRDGFTRQVQTTERHQAFEDFMAKWAAAGCEVDEVE